MNPWDAFVPTLVAGIISGLVAGALTGSLVGWALYAAQRAAIKRGYELEWQSIRSAVLRAISVNDMPDAYDSVTPTQAQAAMQDAIGSKPVRVWAETVKSTELLALVHLLNAWDRRTVSHRPVCSAVGVKAMVAAGNIAGVPAMTTGLWGFVTGAFNTGYEPAETLWKSQSSDTEFMKVVDEFRADYYQVHSARNSLERALTS